MSVSAAWFQICSDPLLWKTLYFQEEWTIAEEVMRDFERRLSLLQSQFDSQVCRIRSSAVSFNSGAWTPSTSMASRARGTDIDDSQCPPQPSRFERLYDQFFNILKS